MGTKGTLVAGMGGARAEIAREQLIDGYRIDYGGGTRRIYPSHAKVARELEVPTSTVTRWAARTGVAAARKEVVRSDLVPNEASLTTEALMVAVAAATQARVQAGYLLSERRLEHLMRLVEWAMAKRAMRAHELDRVRSLLKGLLDVGRLS